MEFFFVVVVVDKIKKFVEKDKVVKLCSLFLIIVLVVVFVVGVVGGGVWYFIQFKYDEKLVKVIVSKGVLVLVQYFGLELLFVVNFNGFFDGLCYLQVEVQLMICDLVVMEVIKVYVLVICVKLLMLFLQVELVQIVDCVGKECLQVDLLVEVQKLFKVEIGIKGVDELLFISFVIQ